MRLLKENVEEGSISMERIDDAVSRILKVKLRNGLFTNPIVQNDNLQVIGSDDHRNIARQAVRESVVVLKNEKMINIYDKKWSHQIDRTRKIITISQEI